MIYCIKNKIHNSVYSMLLLIPIYSMLLIPDCNIIKAISNNISTGWYYFINYKQTRRVSIERLNILGDELPGSLQSIDDNSYDKVTTNSFYAPNKILGSNIVKWKPVKSSKYY